MRKFLLFMVALLIVSITIPVFAADEIELGFSITPLHMIAPGDEGGDFQGDPPPEDYYYEEETDFLDEWLIGFHFGYNIGILYASLDSFVMAPFLVKDMTTRDYYNNTSGEWYTESVDRPGFLNFIDVGMKLNLAKFVLFAEAGINYLYIYRQGEIENDDQKGALGTNLRLGASYRVLKNLSVGLTGTAIFPNFETMGSALKGLLTGSEDSEGAAKQIKLMPMLMITMYL